MLMSQNIANITTLMRQKINCKEYRNRLPFLQEKWKKIAVAEPVQSWGIYSLVCSSSVTATKICLSTQVNRLSCQKLFWNIRAWRTLVTIKVGISKYVKVLWFHAWFQHLQKYINVGSHQRFLLWSDQSGLHFTWTRALELIINLLQFYF